MPRKKKKLTGDLLDRLMQAAKSDPDEPVQVGRVYGIPMPGLAWPWMLGVHLFPLGRIVHLAGMESSYKTSMAYEIGRWHIEAGGYLIYIETESKDNPYQREAFLADYIGQEKVIVHSARSMENWQELITSILKVLKDYLDEQGTVAPVCIVVDSLRGKATSSAIENLLDQGYATKDYPREPLLLTNFFQGITPLVEQLPVTIVFTNHLKEEVMSLLPGQYRTPGGRALKYYESFEIWQQAELPDERHVVRVQFRTKKVQFGSPGRSPTARVVWEGDRAYWDWYTPSVMFLADPSTWKIQLSKGSGSKIIKAIDEDLRQLLGRVVYSPAHKTVTCEAIGVSKVSPEEFMHALSEHPIYPEVLRVLDINTRIEPWVYEEKKDEPEGTSEEGQG